ncbi:hypothetical protein NXS19_010789 [Fusarium pseudograminearum]|nr:hypothetical protein NXS19_010789 [Fusarium pseudograminearum]
MGYTMALEIALGVITLRVLQRNYDSLAKDQSDTERRTANLIRRSKTSLKRSLDSVGRGIVSKLEIIHSLGTQIKTTTCHIVSSIQSIAADVNSIKAIVMHLDRGPGDDHFILEDITGRRFPIHLKTITSWAVLEFILEERFKGKKGARRIQQKRYTLRESKTHREIDGSIPWDSAFLPYQEVNMSLMCNEVESNDTNGKAASSCPFCKMLSDSLASTGVEVKWKSCGRFFTRVVEVDHVKLNQVPGFLAESRCSETTSDEHACTRFHESTNISPQTRPRMGPLPSISGYDSDDEDVRGFVRVHLVSKKIRATEHLAIEDASNHIINHESDLTAPVLHPHSMQELGSTTSCCILPPWRQEKHKKVWHQNPPISNLIPFAPTYTLKKIPYDWDAKRVWNDHLYGITVKKPNSRATYSSRFYG